MNSKKQYLQLVIFPIFFVITTCGGRSNQEAHQNNGAIPSDQGSMANQPAQVSARDMHNLHNSLAENFSHKDILILEPYELTEATKTEMEQAIDAYIKLKNAFVNDDELATDKAAGLMARKVAVVVPTKLQNKGLQAWQNHKEVYESKLKEMQHIKGLDNKRSYFSHVSEIMYCTIKSFELKQDSLFAIFCPMAFDNKGACWISNSKTIQNPYLASKMPNCGEVKEEL